MIKFTCNMTNQNLTTLRKETHFKFLSVKIRNNILKCLAIPSNLVPREKEVVPQLCLHFCFLLYELNVNGLDLY